ncbi:MAG: DUF2723 domain-containing protein [Prevotellaceae bacterium]|jgi:hypothetical protein|nr:DUF2723 domain-containing protein [Prevotellaceae bacterium]
MKVYKLFNNIFGWIVFAIAATVYLLTIEPTTSFWDCGEFISSADGLQVGHPPGAPFFMLTGRFFTLFASDSSQVAFMMNAFSAISSAFCILFLFWTITHLARKIVIGSSREMNAGQMIGILGSGLAGALIYTFSDTFWFSAVEAEVYAFSSFFTAIVFWAILKWEDVADEPYANRWLVLIAYLMGISIGVHLLNLLAIPALVLVYYYKKYKPTTKGTFVALGVSVLLLAVLLYGLIPGFVEVSGWFELLFVNGMGMSFNIGTLVYAIVVIASIVWALWETSQSGEKMDNRKTMRVNVSFILVVTLLGIPFFGGRIFLGIILIAALTWFLFWKKHLVNMAMLNLVLLCFTVILLGYSSYATIIIRSSANPPMDQNSPDDVFSLKSYLNRDQYGDTPLLYGETYASEIKRDKNGYVSDDGAAIWEKRVNSPQEEGDKYIVTGHKKKYQYDFNMLFPRMFSKQPSHIEAYKEWAGIKGSQRPTFGENLTFFFRYQVGFMYFRYFMWNFVGRQNDIQGHGEITNGNWISGINAFDQFRVGDQTNLPEEMANNKGRNVYYFLPLLLGILGIFYQLSKGKEGAQSFWITFVLFFMTGLAIVLYLNQTPYQPRERDYAYAGSFYAFCIWIGLGVLCIAELLSKALDKRVSALLATLICLPVPVLMANQNWNDHDRSNRYTARDFGQNYLMTLPENAVIFTNGDNDTFPLWYNQEVEGVRTDTRVTNLSYLQMAWYADQMKRQAYTSDPLPISFQPYQYSNGRLDVAYLLEMINEPMNLGTAIELLKSNDPKYKSLVAQRYGDDFDFLPTRKFFLPVDSAAALKTGTVSPENAGRIVNQMDLDFSKKSYLGKHEMIILDMLQHNNWERPIYFAVTVGNDSYMGLQDYFQLEGMAYRVVPVKGGNRVNTEAMYDNMMNKFKWGGIENPKVYLDENNLRMTATLRHMFSRLAGGLIAEGKKEKALAALDYCMEVIPSTTVPHTYVSIVLASQYYQLGEKDKAEAILNKMLQTSLDHLAWFTSSLTDSQLHSAAADFAQNFGIFQEILNISKNYGNEELMKENYQLYLEYDKIYGKLFNNNRSR